MHHMRGSKTSQQYYNDFVGVPMTEENLFFHSLVRTIKDYLHYSGPDKNKLIPYKAYLFAKGWIQGSFTACWEGSDLEITFKQALELIGIAPENVPIIRDLLKDAREAPVEERAELCKRVYGVLNWHDNEPEEFGWIGKKR